MIFLNSDSIPVLDSAGRLRDCTQSPCADSGECVRTCLISEFHLVPGCTQSVFDFSKELVNKIVVQISGETHTLYLEQTGGMDRFQKCFYLPSDLNADYDPDAYSKFEEAFANYHADKTTFQEFSAAEATLNATKNKYNNYYSFAQMLENSYSFEQYRSDTPFSAWSIFSNQYLTGNSDDDPEWVRPQKYISLRLSLSCDLIETDWAINFDDSNFSREITKGFYNIASIDACVCPWNESKQAYISENSVYRHCQNITDKSVFDSPQTLRGKAFPWTGFGAVSLESDAGVKYAMHTGFLLAEITSPDWYIMTLSSATTWLSLRVFYGEWARITGPFSTGTRSYDTEKCYAMSFHGENCGAGGGSPPGLKKNDVVPDKKIGPDDDPDIKKDPEPDPEPPIPIPIPPVPPPVPPPPVPLPPPPRPPVPPSPPGPRMDDDTAKQFCFYTFGSTCSAGEWSDPEIVSVESATLSGAPEGYGNGWNVSDGTATIVVKGRETPVLSILTCTDFTPSVSKPKAECYLCSNSWTAEVFANRVQTVDGTHSVYTNRLYHNICFGDYIAYQITVETLGDDNITYRFLKGQDGPEIPSSGVLLYDEEIWIEVQGTTMYTGVRLECSVHSTDSSSILPEDLQ